MKHNFKVGDRVRIRQWEDMAKELGFLSSLGAISTKITAFTPEMKHLCGRIAEIKKIKLDGEVKLHKWSDNSGDTKFVFDIDMIEPTEPEQITITRYGQKVVAKLGQKVGVAKCSPEDEFDFNVGAKLAFARLMGEEIDFPRVYTHKELEEKFNAKEEFKPYLMGDFEFITHYGNIGEETNQTDVFEEKLCVGDVVELYNVNTATLHGERVVVYTCGKYGVRGVHKLDFKNGISNEWRIKKVKSFKDLAHNEKIDDVIAILKEE